ncbi:MAG: hypothetical protein IT425_04875 [Pirellulales bacterium]|nr:hypothetical protein [Pirellulales bacterium]
MPTSRTWRSRFAFSVRFALMAAVWGLPSASGEPADITAVRHQATHRPRRILLNNDGNDATRELDSITPEAILSKRSTPLLGTQVDSIAYATRGVGLDSFTHFTKVGTIFTTNEGEHYSTNRLAELLAAKIDPLRVIAKFGKENRIEVFWSLRMNDNHDASGHEYGAIALKANRFKAAHPEFMFGTAKKRPKYGAWTALDYAHPEVREHAYQLIEEVCRNYDVDGIELDFFRHPVFFRATTRGEIVPDRERELMTVLMQRIRKVADEVGRSRGRPLLLVVRAPDSAEYCRDIGLDLERWMADDLFDIYVPSSYFRLREWKDSVALGHKYHIPVYPSLDEPRIADQNANTMRRTAFAYRARAAEAWLAGADGIYLFNFPDVYGPNSPILNEIGSVDTLARLDKDYFASVLGVRPASGNNLPYGPYRTAETLNPGNPKKLAPGKSVQAKFFYAETTKKSASGSDGPHLKLRLQLQRVAQLSELKVVLNGKEMACATSEPGWVEAVPAPADLLAGLNDVGISLGAKATQAAVWADLILEVRYNRTGTSDSANRPR